MHTPMHVPKICHTSGISHRHPLLRNNSYTIYVRITIQITSHALYRFAVIYSFVNWRILGHVEVLITQ